MCPDHAGVFSFFFFNDTATTEIYTLSLHDALPIFGSNCSRGHVPSWSSRSMASWRSEEHTSELQSHHDLVCRLLLEKKKENTTQITTQHINDAPVIERHLELPH